ncbi:RING finger protein 212B isoform X10 [Ursus americanus]|uniref:RING finger protein 212B isoform X10 n=1 Tax=Ursus americanus TaxID=9643 RepID=UPI001E67DAC3|nr:RING finger protein 212B isoform X10 [Ursus americanus]
MDWFHCNQCFRKDGDHFFVTSCGHIFCKKCVTLEKCAVCGTACKHLALSDNLKPQEKIYFKSPVETAMQYFSHISQVWRFQKKQTDLLIAFYKHRITKLEAAMQEAQQMVTSQEKELSVLKKENGELKKCLAILKVGHTSTSGHYFSITVRLARQGRPRHGWQLFTPHLIVFQSLHDPVLGIAARWSVGPPQWNLSLTECLALVAWDKEPEACREEALPGTLILKPLHQLLLTAYLTGLHLPLLDRGFFLSDHP